MMNFVKELIDFIGELASGELTIEDARKRATALQAKQPEQFTDLLRAELDAKISALDS